MKTNYRLLDTGRGKRLEEFGGIRIVREAKQAVWPPALPDSEWQKAAAVYDGSKWLSSSDEFNVFFDDAVFALGLLETGQVGIFPEQAENWSWLRSITAGRSQKIINGFAYTGGSSIFASNSTNSVTHLDASKPAVKRAGQNAELSKAENIRYIVDDVVTFLEKEVSRGNTYQGFIFDPPAFGRGGKGKTWKLEKDLPKLIRLINLLSDCRPEFVLLSAHEPTMDSRALADLLRPITPKGAKLEHRELVMKTESGQRMQNGYYARFTI